MTTWLKSIGGVAIALLVGFLWLRFVYTPRIRAEDRALAQLEATRAHAHADSLVAAARDSTFRAESSKREAQLAAAHRVTVRIAAVANAIAPRVRAAVVDSLRPLFDSLEQAKDSTIAATMRERDLEHARWVKALAAVSFQRDTVVPKLREDLAAALDQAAAALKKAGRHWHLGGAGGCGFTAAGASCPTFAVGIVYTP